VAKETAGAFAAWSLQVEASPGPLAATADALARSSQVRAHQARGQRAGVPSAKGAALLLASVGHGGTGTVAQAALLVQLANTAKALHDAHRAGGDARRAAEIARVVRAQLAAVSAALPAHQMVGTGTGTGVDEQAAQAARVARTGQVPLRAPGSPVPADLRPRPGGAPPALAARAGAAREEGSGRG
jgi:hypothetical protein